MRTFALFALAATTEAFVASPLCIAPCREARVTVIVNQFGKKPSLPPPPPPPKKGAFSFLQFDSPVNVPSKPEKGAKKASGKVVESTNGMGKSSSTPTSGLSFPNFGAKLSPTPSPTPPKPQPGFKNPFATLNTKSAPAPSPPAPPPRLPKPAFQNPFASLVAQAPAAPVSSKALKDQNGKPTPVDSSPSAPKSLFGDLKLPPIPSLSEDQETVAPAVFDDPPVDFDESTDVAPAASGVDGSLLGAGVAGAAVGGVLADVAVTAAGVGITGELLTDAAAVGAVALGGAAAYAATRPDEAGAAARFVGGSVANTTSAYAELAAVSAELALLEQQQKAISKVDETVASAKALPGEVKAKVSIASPHTTELQAHCDSQLAP